MVRIRLYGRLKELCGEEVEIRANEGIRLRELIKELIESCRELGNEILDRRTSTISSSFNILINGKHCMFIDGLDTQISNDDIVDIIPPISGGFSKMFFKDENVD